MQVSIILSLYKRRSYNRHTPQVQTLPAEFKPAHTRTDDVSFGVTTMVHYYHAANSSIRFCTAGTVVQQNQTYGKRTDVHRAIKITNQKSVRVQNEFRHFLT
jgi:hypothetical protein